MNSLVATHVQLLEQRRLLLTQLDAVNAQITASEAKLMVAYKQPVEVDPTNPKRKSTHHQVPASAATDTSSKPAERKRRKYKRRAALRPGEPKKPLSAYHLFIQAERPKIAAQHRGEDFTGIGKIVGHRWTGLMPAEKRPYVTKAAELKVEYQKAMAAFNATQQSSPAPASGANSAVSSAALLAASAILVSSPRQAALEPEEEADDIAMVPADSIDEDEDGDETEDEDEADTSDAAFIDDSGLPKPAKKRLRKGQNVACLLVDSDASDDDEQDL